MMLLMMMSVWQVLTCQWLVYMLPSSHQSWLWKGSTLHHGSMHSCTSDLWLAPRMSSHLFIVNIWKLWTPDCILYFWCSSVFCFSLFFYFLVSYDKTYPSVFDCTLNNFLIEWLIDNSCGAVKYVCCLLLAWMYLQLMMNDNDNDKDTGLLQSRVLHYVCCVQRRQSIWCILTMCSTDGKSTEGCSAGMLHFQLYLYSLEALQLNFYRCADLPFSKYRDIWSVATKYCNIGYSGKLQCKVPTFDFLMLVIVEIWGQTIVCCAESSCHVS